MHTTCALNERTRLDLDLALARDAHALPTCFETDLDCDGKREFCLRQGDFFIALQGAQLRACQRRLLHYLAPAWIEARHRQVLKRIGGRLQWEREIPHLDGPAAPQRIIALDEGDLDGDGRGELLAFLGDGRLWALDLDGREVAHINLGRGLVDSALFFDLPDQEGCLISVFYRRGDRTGINPIHPGWITFALKGGEVGERWEGIGIRARLGENLYLTQDGRLCGAGGALGEKTPPLCLLPDVRGADRALLALADVDRGLLRLQDAAGHPLWQCALPATQAADYRLCGVAGSPGTPGEALTAVLFETRYKEGRYHSWIAEKHLWLLDEDGNLLGACRYPPWLGEWTNQPIVLLEDIDGDGEAEITVVEDQSVRIWARGTEVLAPQSGERSGRIWQGGYKTAVTRAADRIYCACGASTRGPCPEPVPPG